MSGDVLARSEELEAEVNGSRASPSAVRGSSKAAGKQAADKESPAGDGPTAQSPKSPLARLFSHGMSDAISGSTALLGAGAGQDLLQELRELKCRQEYVRRLPTDVLRF